MTDDTQGIDRDAVIEAYQQTWEEYQRADRPRLFRDALADRILALVRPVEGVTLTPEEAADARAALVLANAYEARAEDTWDETEDPIRVRWRALAARLEAG